MPNQDVERIKALFSVKAKELRRKDEAQIREAHELAEKDFTLWVKFVEKKLNEDDSLCIYAFYAMPGFIPCKDAPRISLRSEDLGEEYVQELQKLFGDPIHVAFSFGEEIIDHHIEIGYVFKIWWEESDK